MGIALQVILGTTLAVLALMVGALVGMTMIGLGVAAVLSGGGKRCRKRWFASAVTKVLRLCGRGRTGTHS